MKTLLQSFGFAFLMLAAFVSVSHADQPRGSEEDALTLVVMDPLCDRLACDCVEGYAQRKYEALAEHLSKSLGRNCKIVWGESIQAALEETDFSADVVVGKHSVVVGNAKTLELDLKPVAQLTGKDGSVYQTGLIVVRRDDPATTVSDLEGYRVFFGPEDCDEKYAAPMQLLKESGIGLPANPEISGACSEAATKLVELSQDVKAAAIISSYAEPLLAGCGTIEKGDLRVIGVSDEVPFVTAFVNQKLDAELQQQISKALIKASDNSDLIKSLETQRGFVPFANDKSAEPNDESSKKK